MQVCFLKKYRNLVWISADVDLLLQRLASDRKKLSFMSFQSVEGTDWWGTLRWCNFTLRQTVPGQKKITKRCLNKLPQRFEIRLVEERDDTSTVQGSSLRKSKTKQNNGYNSLHNTPNKPGSSLYPLSLTLSCWKLQYLGFMFWCEFVPKWARWCNAPVCEGEDYFVQLHRPHLLYFRAGRIGLCRLSQWLTQRKEPHRNFGCALNISQTWDHPEDQTKCIIGHSTLCNITALPKAVSEKDREIRGRWKGIMIL